MEGSWWVGRLNFVSSRLVVQQRDQQRTSTLSTTRRGRILLALSHPNTWSGLERITANGVLTGVSLKGIRPNDLIRLAIAPMLTSSCCDIERAFRSSTDSAIEYNKGLVADAKERKVCR